MTIDEVLEQQGREVHSIEGSASLEEAARAIHRANIRCIAVRREGRVVGLVGEREICHAVAQARATALSIDAQKVMARFSACARSHDLAKISRRMTNERVRHILVLDDGQIAGIISLGDILKRRLSECQLEVRVLRDYARPRVTPC